MFENLFTPEPEEGRGGGRGFRKDQPGQPGRPGRGGGRDRQGGRNAGRPAPGREVARRQDVKPDPVGVAVAGTARWIAEKPLSRGLGACLVGLYPVGGMVHGVDPWVLAGFAPAVAFPAFVAMRRAADEELARLVAGAAAAVPAWLAVAAHTGILSWPVLLGYTAAAGAGWSAMVTSDAVVGRRSRAERAQAWTEGATKVGLAGSRLVKVEETRLGQVLHIDVRGTGRTASAIVRSDMRERLAAELGLPLIRVRVAPDAKHAGMIVIAIRTIDPWSVPSLHPIHDPDAEVQLPATRSICDGPAEVGMDPETGDPLAIELFEPDEGAVHGLIIAAMGGGKTVLLNNVIERLSACRDALIWAIDLIKAKDLRRWGPVLDWYAAGAGEAARALLILRAAVWIIEQRAARSMSAVHKPSPDAPFIQIIIDEGSSLLGRQDKIGDQARTLVATINSTGRSEGVGLLIASQRGTLSHLGTSNLKANSFTRVALGMTQRSEMRHVLPDHETLGLPDMSKYGEGHKGVALVVNRDNTWAAGRTFFLHGLEDIAEIAASRADRPVQLEPWLAAKLGPAYADRHRTAAMPPSAGGDPGPSDPGPGSTGPGGPATTAGGPQQARSGLLTEDRPSSGPRPGGQPTTGSGDIWREPPSTPAPAGGGESTGDSSAEPADQLGQQPGQELERTEDGLQDAFDARFSVITQALRVTSKVADEIEALAEAAAERPEYESRQRWAGRVAKGRDEAQKGDQDRGGSGVPDQVTAEMQAAVVALVTERGAAGAPRRDIVELEEWKKASSASVSRYLKSLVTAGVLATRGNTSAAVYVLPAYAEETGESGDSQ
jgi:hypothetical protein